MMIWLLALILIASVAALGYRQGGIRVAFSFLGIVVGALLAVPLGHLVSRLLVTCGIKDPLLVWALGPVIVFILISAGFKVGAATVHQKVDVHYKYHAGDLRLALWERLNRRLGLCLGVLNGIAYAVLLAFVIYVPSYATLQLASSDQDPKWMRFLNLLGRDLHSTGMDKVARSIDTMPEVNYRMVDMATLLYRNPLSQARLSSYPGFFSLAELPEFVSLAGDKSFFETWDHREPVMALLDHQQIQNIRNNPGLLKLIWNSVAPDLADLRDYLLTGRSAKYDPIKILGHWKFDVRAAVGAMRRARPTISSREMQNLRRFMDAAFSRTALVARPDHSASLKNTPGLRLPAAVPNTSPTLQNLQGQWRDSDNQYQLSFSGNDLKALVEGDRLTMKTDGPDMVFTRED